MERALFLKLGETAAVKYSDKNHFTVEKSENLT